MRGRFIISLALLCLIWAAPCPAAEEQTVGNGVFVDGMDFGGMTRSQAEDAVYERIWELGKKKITISGGDKEQTYTFNDLGLTWGNTNILDEIFSLGASGNIVQRYKDQKDLAHDQKTYDLTFTLDDEMVSAFAGDCTDTFNTDPVNASMYTKDDLTPGIEGGTDGITVLTEDACTVLTDAAESWDGVSDVAIDLPVERKEPDVSYDSLSMVKDELGSAYTEYGGYGDARSLNVENGCSKITGTLLQPGDYFSVTDALVPFTAENGYEKAGSYEENRVVDSYGGGICQVSTTLYNAVLKAELEVVSRSNHTMVVGYVDLSKDAAIAEGVMDFAFVNNLEDPVYIIGACYDGLIHFSIYGHETRPANRTLEFESRTIAVVEPSAAMLVANPGQSVGYIYQTQSPHTGYEAELWKNIYIDGELQESVQINSSTYSAVGTIYEIGVASSSQALTQAMYNAVATGDLNQVQNVIANGVKEEKETDSEKKDDSDSDNSDSDGSDTSSDGEESQNMAGYDEESGDMDEITVY